MSGKRDIHCVVVVLVVVTINESNVCERVDGLKLITFFDFLLSFISIFSLEMKVNVHVIVNVKYSF